MAQGVLEMKGNNAEIPTHIEDRIQYFLDRFYINRIGIRMLIHQHRELIPTVLLCSHWDEFTEIVLFCQVVQISPND